MGGEKKQENIDSTNIFEEFSQDENLKSEVKSTQVKKEKWGYYYLWVINKFFKLINTIFFLWFIIIGGYLYVQNNEAIKDISYLDPICFMFVDKWLLIEWESCSSISSLTKRYRELNSNLSNKYYMGIANIIEDVYYVSNFAFSKEILFLLDKTENRLLPLAILEEFDRLKNEFEPINKGKLLCTNINISWGGVLSIDCNAFSSRWDRNIVWLSWKNQKSENVSGTSISLASSFINYLEMNARDFIIIDKQKEFTFDEVADYWGYSRKTNFKLTLKLRSNTLSLN